MQFLNAAVVCVLAAIFHNTQSASIPEVHNLETRQVQQGESAFVKCYRDIVNTFGKKDVDAWEKNVGYDKSGALTKAPISLACFDQCTFANEQLTDAKGFVTSSGYDKFIQQATQYNDQNMLPEFQKLQQYTKSCEADYKNNKLTKVTFDTALIKNTKYSEEACRQAMTMNMCVDRFEYPKEVTAQLVLTNVIQSVKTLGI